VKISLSLFLLVGYSGYTACSIPYILFKLEEIKKGEAFSLDEHAL